MPESVKLANDIRSHVNFLVERLYKTDEGIQFAKDVDIQIIADELVRLSQKIVLSTVSDAVALEEA